MEYRFSTLMDTSAYETEGLCDGLPLRVHNDPLLEEIGTIRAQEDWSRLVSPIEHYAGGLAAQHSFMAMNVPECIPERLEIISYANEFAFLHDGTSFLFLTCLGIAESCQTTWIKLVRSR